MAHYIIRNTLCQVFFYYWISPAELDPRGWLWLVAGLPDCRL